MIVYVVLGIHGGSLFCLFSSAARASPCPRRDGVEREEERGSEEASRHVEQSSAQLIGCPDRREHERERTLACSTTDGGRKRDPCRNALCEVMV